MHSGLPEANEMSVFDRGLQNSRTDVTPSIMAVSQSQRCRDYDLMQKCQNLFFKSAPCGQIARISPYVKNDPASRFRKTCGSCDNAKAA